MTRGARAASHHGADQEGSTVRRPRLAVLALSLKRGFQRVMSLSTSEMRNAARASHLCAILRRRQMTGTLLVQA